MQKFFIVGSNNNQTKFRILRLDRTEPYELNILDDGLEYNEKEVHQMLQYGIKTKNSSATLPKPLSAFGIVGKLLFTICNDKKEMTTPIHFSLSYFNQVLLDF